MVEEKKTSSILNIIMILVIIGLIAWICVLYKNDKNTKVRFGKERYSLIKAVENAGYEIRPTGEATNEEMANFTYDTKKTVYKLVKKSETKPEDYKD